MFRIADGTFTMVDPDDIARVAAEELGDAAANDYVEMFATLDTGLLFEDIQKTKPKIEETSIEEFAKT
jgi:hypothetical protein